MQLASVWTIYYSRTRRMLSRATFLCSTPRHCSSNAPPNPNTAPPSAPSALPRYVDYAEVKKGLLGPTFTTKVWYVIALVSAGVALFSYFKDRDNTPERALSLALGEINNDVDRIKQDGFNILNQALFATKRLFSGPVGLPVGTQHLASQNVIKALLDNVHSSNPEIASQAAEWILKLSSPTVLPRNYEKVRSLMFNLDPGLCSITKLLVAEDYSAEGGCWVVASRILSSLNEEELSKVSLEGLSTGIKAMLSSSNPAASTLAANLFQKLTPFQQDQFEEETKSLLITLSLSLHNHPLSLSEVSQLERKLSSARNAVGPTASPWSILAFSYVSPSTFLNLSVFATIWGKTMWRLSLHLSPVFYRLTQHLESPKKKEMRQRFLRSRSVGTAVFGLLMFDYLAARYLQDPMYFPEELTETLGLPASTVIPVAQTSLLTLGTLLAVKTQRFVIVPLLLAGVYNHWDLLDPLAQKYIPALPDTYVETEEKLATVRREVASWLADER